jgi:hypothetical protein
LEVIWTGHGGWRRVLKAKKGLLESLRSEM